MGQGKNDSDYKKLEDGPKDASKNGHGVEEEKKEENGTMVAIWFGLVLFAFALTSGVCPAAPLFIQGFAGAGVCSHLCTNGEKQCAQSTLMVSNIVTLAAYTMNLASTPTGVLFDKAGGKIVTVIGAAMTTGSWLLMLVPVAGAASGSDSVTWTIFAFAVVVNFVGFKFVCAGLACTLYWVHTYLSLAFTAFTTALSLSSFLPLAVLPQVGRSLSMATVLVGFTITHTIGTTLFLFIVPTIAQFEAKAEEVTGMKVKVGESNVMNVISVGCRVMKANFFEHMFFLFTLNVGMTWTVVYNNLSPQYLVAIMGDPFNPDPSIVATQTRDVTLAMNAMALGVAPFLAFLSEKLGPKFTPTALMGFCCLAIPLMGVPNLNVHFVVAGFSTYLATACPVQVNIRSFFYASSSRVGTVQGILNSVFAAMGMPMAMGLQSYLASLDDPKTEYRPVFITMNIVGFLGLVCFFLQAVILGVPSSPVLLREDETDICVSYGCKYIKEVMYVLEMQDRELLLSLLSSSDPDTQMNLVMHINVDRLVEKLMDRDVDEIIASIKAGIAWRRKTAIADQGVAMLQIGGMGFGAGNLAKMLKVDTTKYGTGQAKTLDQFESEISKGRSKIIIDENDPSKMKRLVALVVLRIYTGNDMNKKLMVQMSEQFPDGRTRMKPQLPGTKRGPNDTVKDCVAKVLAKYTMQDLSIQFLYDRTEVTEETQESPSYPGVFTTYQKEFVDGYITETNRNSLQEVGLPLAVAWSTFHEKTKYTYLCEWLTDQDATDKGIVVTGKEASPNDQPATTAAVTSATPAKLKTPKEIIRSLEARDFSKKLVFMLQMEDADEIEHWLLTENVHSMREAFLDLENWPDAEPENMMKKFESLVPEETMAGLMRSRPTLKPLVIDFLKSDLMKVQHENADKKKELKADV
mmetsp:Transcript_138200/g.240454  ORF Transcript_138200/g.240454 Transcript_138200/m.240454 type:complete len:915 (-) Transcript_138200:65-2809(-)